MSPGNADYGFFTAIAERLRAGDRLYVDVWDNKDPLVYYSIALARTFGPAGAWFLEVLWVVLGSASTLAISRKVEVRTVLAVFVSFVLGPFILLGYLYFVGITQLPGVALTLAALALLLLDRPVMAGVGVGLVLFAKLIMGPLAIIVLITTALMTGKRQAFRGLFAGLFGLVASFVVVMAVRGELVEFANTQILNARYSQAPIVSASYTGLSQKIAQHLVILVNPHVAGILMTSGLVLLALGWRYRAMSSTHQWAHSRMLWWVSAVALVVEAVTVLITGKWLGHAEILATSSLLILVLLAGSLSIVQQAPGWVTVAVSVVAAFFLAGAPSPGTYVDVAREIGVNWSEAQETDPLTQILRGLEPTSVAFVGEGNLVPRTGGLDGWTIACRHIAQRPFEQETTFHETLACLPSAGLVVVTEDNSPDSAFPANNQFLASVNSLLAKGYDCKDYQGFRSFRVCRKAAS
jgi:hypothetical protein